MRKRKRPEPEKSAWDKAQLMHLNLKEISGGMIRERAAQQPRQLAASIARHGLLSPLVVRREEGAAGYRLVCGARRLAACKLLGMTRIPALLIDADAAQAAACFMEEHLTREAPGAMEEAQAIALSGGMEAAGESVLCEAAFSRLLSLLSLDEETRRIAREGGLSLEQTEPLRSIARQDWRQEAAQMIADRQLTGAQARRLVFGPRGMREESPRMTGKRRTIQAVTREVERLRERLNAQGIDAQISVLSRGDGLCVHLTLGGKQRRSEQEKRGCGENTSRKRDAQRSGGNEA